MNAIILAAGIGSRIGTIGASTPKCLLSVAGEPLLVHQVRKLKSSGIENITAVVGGQGSCWSESVYKTIKPIVDRVVTNESNVSLGRAYSLWKGLQSWVKGPLLIVDGDLWFEKMVGDIFLESAKENLFLVAKAGVDTVGRKVYAESSSGRIVAFGKQNIEKNNRIETFVNAGLIKLGERVLAEVRKRLSEGSFFTEPVTELLEEVRSNETDWYVEIVGGKWVNINTPEGISEAEKLSGEKSCAVLWDCDGVLANTTPMQLKAYKRAFAQQGVQIEDRDYVLNAGRKDIFQHICSVYGVACNFEQWYETKTRVYWDELAKGLSIEPGVLALLSDLENQGYVQAVVSSTSRANLTRILSQLGIRKFFQELISFEDCSKGKPHPDPFLKAAQILGVSCPRCLVIEDSIYGVTAAQAAGMRCIQVMTEEIESSSKELSDWQVESLEAVSVDQITQLING